MTEAHLLDYKALRDTMLRSHPEAFTSDAQTELTRDMSSYRSRLAGGADGLTLFTLLAWHGPRLVGAISCERESRSKVQHVAHIVGMMVADSARGAGVGRQLLATGLHLLRGNPALELVTLSVTASNVAAVQLYRTAGFERYGRLEGALKLPDGRVLAKDFMSLRLG